MPKLFHILWKAKAPLFILIFVSVVNLLVHYKVIPPPSVLIVELKKWFGMYGLPLISAFAFLESIVGFNVYFPGSVVILVAMSLTAGRPYQAVLLWFLIVIPFIVGYNIDFLIGRLLSPHVGGSKSTDINLAARRGSWNLWILFLSTFWHPHFAAVTSSACGASSISYKCFLRHLLPASLLWNSFWGVTMYYLGRISNGNLDFTRTSYIFLIVWLIWDVQRSISMGEIEHEQN